MQENKILVFAGSLRMGSLNCKLGETPARWLEEHGTTVTRLDLRDYKLPIYDPDLEEDEGLHDAALRLHEQFRSHRGIFIASPEYNANVSPLLLNVLTWVSRVSEDGGTEAAFGHPVFALGSASPGPFGDYRGLMVLRQSLELQLMARVLPRMIPVGAAHEAFDEDGNLRNARTDGLLSRVLNLLVKTTAEER